eukprot:2601412-Rhodomonas_salina.3
MHKSNSNPGRSGSTSTGTGWKNSEDNFCTLIQLPQVELRLPPGMIIRGVPEYPTYIVHCPFHSTPSLLALTRRPTYRLSENLATQLCGNGDLNILIGDLIATSGILLLPVGIPSLVFKTAVLPKAPDVAYLFSFGSNKQSSTRVPLADFPGTRGTRGIDTNFVFVSRAERGAIPFTVSVHDSNGSVPGYPGYPGTRVC